MHEAIAMDASETPVVADAPRSSSADGAEPSSPATGETALPPGETAPDPPPPASQSAPAPIEYPFEFRGNEREYFRIWIVNLALTILTLGIWSAWAKVRTERYFYANTRVAGSPFEYLAKPLPILRGRVVAFTLFTSYLLASRFSVKLQLALLGVILLVSPWLIVRGLMFRARYSSWRGLTFRFVPEYRAAYRNYLFVYLLVPLTLGLIFPYIKWLQKQFVVEHHRFGGREFRLAAKVGDFYVVYFIAIGILIGAYIGIFAGLSTAFSGAARSGIDPMTIIYAMMIVTYALYFAVFVFLAARILNLTYNNAVMDGFALRSSVRARDLMKLYLFNTCGIVLSIGMLIPWAMIRMAHYRAARLILLASDDLDALTAEGQGDISAVGAEMDHVFDLDIGL